VRELAIAVLAERRDPAVVPALLGRLQSEDVTVVRRTIGQLVEIGDDRASIALIDLSRGKDLGFQRELLFALGSLGGEEAEAYLFTVAQGHDQPAIRAVAAQALEELKNRRAPAGTRAEEKR
jgi:HEAT repeat protein